MSAPSSSPTRRSRSARSGAARPDGRDREDREALVDEGHGPVAEVGGGVRVGDDVGELLELERPLARGRVAEAPAHDDARVPRREGGRGLGDRRLGGQRLGDRVGDAGQLRVRAQRVRRPLEGGGEQRDRGQLGRVGLGRGDRELRAGPEVDHVVRGRRERRVRVVGDRDRRDALAAARLDDADDVRRGARLADPEHERPARAAARRRRSTAPTASRGPPGSRAARRTGTARGSRHGPRSRGRRPARGRSRGARTTSARRPSSGARSSSRATTWGCSRDLARDASCRALRRRRAARPGAGRGTGWRRTAPGPAPSGSVRAARRRRHGSRRPGTPRRPRASAATPSPAGGPSRPPPRPAGPAAGRRSRRSCPRPRSPRRGRPPRPRRCRRRSAGGR